MAAHCLRRVLSPIRVPISPSNPISGRYELLKIWSKSIRHVSPTHALGFSLIRNTQRKVLQNLNLSGRKLFSGSLLGLSTVAGVMYNQSTVVYAMDDYADSGEPSGFLKKDLDNLWSLLKKFQLPVVFLITIFLGWRHPITLAINVAILLFCTKPNPSSIHIFIEEFRRGDLRHDPTLFKSKVFYIKKVAVQDFKLLCYGTVELRDVKLDVVGVLGSWWVLQASAI